jgi:hypothetical protein
MMELFLVGQYISGQAATMLWQFAGIFDTVEGATAACRDRSYCIAVVKLNEPVPHETSTFPVCWYPLAGETRPNGDQ